MSIDMDLVMYHLPKMILLCLVCATAFFGIPAFIEACEKMGKDN